MSRLTENTIVIKKENRSDLVSLCDNTPRCWFGDFVYEDDNICVAVFDSNYSVETELCQAGIKPIIHEIKDEDGIYTEKNGMYSRIHCAALLKRMIPAEKYPEVKRKIQYTI